jgi:hypothetical protein
VDIRAATIGDAVPHPVGTPVSADALSFAVHVAVTLQKGSTAFGHIGPSETALI